MESEGQARYPVIVEALASRPGVSRSALKGFGAGGLMVHGRLFAMPRHDDLLLKLPAARVAAERWLALAEEAMGFVAGG